MCSSTRRLTSPAQLGFAAPAVAIALAVLACGAPPERNPFGGTAPLGTIGSGPVGDADDADDTSDEASSSDDNADEATTGSAGDGASASATQGTSDTMPANTTTASGGETGSGDPVLDACLDLAVDACQQCACNLCLDPLYACQQDPGCVAMRDCAEQYGCQGADCLEPCGAVVDMYGGPFGASGALALELSDCLVASCPTCF